jgi:hypothetical protein
MASVGSHVFYNAESLNANATSEAKNTEMGQLDFIAMLKLANTAGATVAGDIEHSPDGINWLVLDSFTGLAADGVELVEITGFVLPRVRANLTVSGGSADVTCALWFDRRGK